MQQTLSYAPVAVLRFWDQFAKGLCSRRKLRFHCSRPSRPAIKLSHELSEDVNESHEEWVGHFCLRLGLVDPDSHTFLSSSSTSIASHNPSCPRRERPSTRLHHLRDADVRANFQTSSAMNRIRTCTVEQIPDADRRKFPTHQLPQTKRCFHWKLLPSTCQTKTEGELRILCCERSRQFCRCTTKTLNGFHSVKHNTQSPLPCQRDQ